MSTSLVPLYDYQRRWVQDPARNKAALWSRSAGKTHALTLEPVIDCELAETESRPTSWFFFSASEVQTKEMVRYAAIHSQAIGLGAELQDEEHVIQERGENKRVTMLSLQYEHGSRIVGLPTNPFSIRGKHGNLLGDEAGHWPHAQELWTAAAPIASRSHFKVRLCGTAGARRGPFYEIMEGGRAGWSRHKVDVHQAIAEGCPINLDDVYAMFGRGRMFGTEFLLQWEDEDARLIGLDLIMECEDSDTLLVPELRISAETDRNWRHLLDADKFAMRGEGYDKPSAWARLFESLKGRPNLFLGYDVGRKRDLAALTIVEPDGLFRRVRAVVLLEKRRFAEQRACLWAALQHCRRGCIDETGIGAQLAEETVEEFGGFKVEGVTFTGPVKEDLAVRLLRGYEDRTNRVPRSPTFRESTHSVYKTTTAAGNVRYDADQTEQTGHADVFWSHGLSLMAAGDGGADVPFVQSSGARTWSRAGAFGV